MCATLQFLSIERHFSVGVVCSMFLLLFLRSFKQTVSVWGSEGLCDFCNCFFADKRDTLHSKQNRLRTAIKRTLEHFFLINRKISKQRQCQSKIIKFTVPFRFICRAMENALDILQSILSDPSSDIFHVLSFESVYPFSVTINMNRTNEESGGFTC